MIKKNNQLWQYALLSKAVPSFTALSVFLCMQAAPAYARDGSDKSKLTHSWLHQATLISGYIKNAKGEALQGVSIKIKGKSIGTTSLASGAFSLQADIGDKLFISNVGYQTQEIVIIDQQNLNIVLQEETSNIEEVVVLGYGTQKKTNVTGSVQVIKAEALENRPATNITGLLQGQANGITFSTPGGGMGPGAAQTIQIRGSAALSGSTPPLIVIDGIPANMNDFNTLNPEDVENISILKDAAASAIYGSRAPYGVIVVSLKKGKRNQAAKLLYSNNTALVKPIHYPDPTDAYTFAVARNESFFNSKLTPYFSADNLTLIKKNVDFPGTVPLEELVPLQSNGSWGWGDNVFANTNWFDIWLKNSIQQTHNLSLTGGSEKTNYYTSMAYLDQPSIFNYITDIDNYKRFSLNGGFNTDVNSWIKLGFSTRYSYEKRISPTTGMDLLYNYMYGAWPVVPLKNPNGEYNESSRVNSMMSTGNIQDKQHRLDNVLQLDMQPAKGWDIHIDGTWRIFFEDYKRLNQVYNQRYFQDGRTTPLGTSGISKTFDISPYWTVQAYTSYATQINKHALKFQIGGQGEEYNNHRLSGSGQKMLMNDNYSINLAQQGKTSSDAMSSFSSLGFFGRFNYSFDDRYLFEANGRYDGSANYASEKRWGFFPSVSGGWLLSKEDFWTDLAPVINFAKIRASYGTLGNQGNSVNFQYIPTIAVGANTAWVFGDATLPFANPPSIINPDITWDKITTLDIGTELNFLNNRLSTSFAWFNRRSWNLLGPPSPTPSVLGAPAPALNNSEFVTKGFELQVNWNDHIANNWNYGVGVMLSDANSKITKYNVAEHYIGQWYPGMHLGDIWGYEVNRFLKQSDFNPDGTLKINQSQINAVWYPGDVKYEDLNGDGKITTGQGTVDQPGDMRLLGNSTTRYNFAVNFNLGYTFENTGKLELSGLLQGSLKHTIPGNFAYYYWGMGSGNGSDINIYQGAHQLDFYRDQTASAELIDLLGINEDAYFPRPYRGYEGFKNFQTNSRYLINGAYMRLKNLQLAYTFPSPWLRAVKLSSCQVYFSGENLFTIQSKSLPYYIDPEASAGGRSYIMQARYSLGLKLGF